MSSAFNPATRAFDAWLSRRCNEAVAAETRKLCPNVASENRFADARLRLAGFLGGVLAGAQAAGDEVIAGIDADGVDFAAIADKWLRAAAEHGGLSGGARRACR